LAKRIVNRIARDPKFRAKLMNDPERAMKEAGFAKEIAEHERAMVQATASSCSNTCNATCKGWTCTANYTSSA